MATIQIVLDPELLEQTDQFAKTDKLNRSAFIRRALQEEIKRRHIKQLEEQERLAYLAMPETAEELEDLEVAATWLD